MRKKDKSNILIVVIFFIGLSVLLYPTISDFWNSKRQSKVIDEYVNKISSITVNDCSEILNAADDYNSRLSELGFPFFEYDKVDGYNDCLNVMGTGVMGYIDIEKIGVELPICHGTSDDVLNDCVGHLEGSSLPTGEPGTHTVLSAHRGLPSARLFTDLDELEVGDTFTITVLNEVYTYTIDQISIVEPDDTELLMPESGKAYCTLMTCTPYGINTHRLLVRGVKTDTQLNKNIYISNEAYKVDPLVVTPVVALPILLVLLIYLLIKYRDRKESRQRQNRRKR